jgi:hypothetical protein
MNPAKRTDHETSITPEPGQAAGPPRWASVLGIAAVVLVVGVMVVLHLTGVLGGGGH